MPYCVTLWVKEKLLVTCNFSFSNNVFHNYIFLVHQNAVLCGNGLILSQSTNLGASELEEFVDDNFVFGENGRKFFKQIENTMGKGENCSLWAFSTLSDSIFTKLELQSCKNQGLFGKGINILVLNLLNIKLN